MQGNGQVVAGNLTPQSLVLATDIDVLPADRVVLRRDGYRVVRSPSNPGHYWGNFLIFDGPPAPGDRTAWLAAFEAELPGLGHRTLAWDVVDGSFGAAREEFPDFELDQAVGLVAAPGAISLHGRASSAVAVRALEVPEPGWDRVLDLWRVQNAEREEPFPAEAYEDYARRRLAELQDLFTAGRGAWFVAEMDGLVVGSLGVVVTDGRARYQSVDTRSTHRGRGIASRLVYEAARHTAGEWPVESFVIAADLDYHALGIYESLGFRRVEQVTGLCRWSADIRIEP
jgi:ribosomal protein S18 acetylase RimI-like enzyme